MQLPIEPEGKSPARAAKKLRSNHMLSGQGPNPALCRTLVVTVTKPQLFYLFMQKTYYKYIYEH